MTVISILSKGKLVWLAVLCQLLIGCATQTRPVIKQPTGLFNDSLFSAPVEAVPDPNQIFTLSDDQLVMLDNMIRPRRGSSGASELVKSLFKKDYSSFDYDNSYTRSAYDTLDQRAGNCLSMVIMTAAIAKHFEIPFKYQNIKSTPVWDREGDLYLINGHINIRLMKDSGDLWSTSYGPESEAAITIDFIPQATRRGIAREVIDEARVVAMYYNNLAADEMVRDQWSQAYWLLREALLSDPGYSAAWNNLGVIYRHVGQDPLAEQAYQHALALNPNDNNAVSNLVLLLQGQERLAEMYEYQRQYDLAQLNNPFYYFDQAELAFQDGEFYEAISLYKKAIKRSDFVDRFYFGLFKSYWQLKKYGQAKKYLQLAESHSQDLKDRQRYNVKLALLKEGAY